ncbi:Autophagy-related protein 13 [Trichophyton interdigitale]|uniref:Autophagy-related protein 13 n=1 Tax=Trichophyton interdigitale TaxID=101480 RepID=A0A9P5CX78_9EURO|nr:Autophagy protein 13 [Trichophyton interdigitale]KAF3901062.1 Autophagy protein 13 [Trichophyton interdigitale]KAG8212082.1 Autophagy-related protein 13 [Trichophyton interdigitale]
MHQRPRPLPRPASEAPNSPIPADGRPLSDKQVQDQIAKLNQIIQNYHTKAALIILHSRAVLRPIYREGVKKVNKWFNVEVDDTDTLREDLTQWRNCTATDKRPEPLIIETFLDGSQLQKHEELVILDDHGKRWDVFDALSDTPGGPPEKKRGTRNEVILERWVIELGPSSSSGLPGDMTHILPTTYKKCIITFRSLFAYSKFLPAWKFMKRQSKVASHPALRLQHRIIPASKSQYGSRSDPLAIPLCGSSSDEPDTYSFGVTESPAGPLSIRVTYRINCEFRVDDAESIFSSRFMGVDDDLFRPSLPSANDREEQVRAQNVDIGSLPAKHRASNNPDLSQAYGSMSTFHRADPSIKGSPISALRAARDLVGGSPSPPTQMPSPKLGHARVASLSGEDGHSLQRRPSVSYQPFKAPPLSASPGPSAPRSPSTREPLNISVNPTQNVPGAAPSPRRIPNSSTRPLSAHVLPDQAVFSSMSASPKQAPISKYSSSFSHRRGRLSTGGGSKTEEDNNSSGKASISSSSAMATGQRDSTSGVFPVVDTDEDNISEFLKMLDQRKDLLSNGPDGSTFDPASSRRTTTATLSRFQKMKDANTALSDSMTSSLLLHRSTASSSSKHLPPAATSNPTATAAANSLPSGISGSISSSPGKAISPHTPHTPAVPSRLSSNSVIEYPSPDEPGHVITTNTRSRRAPRHESPLGETSEPDQESESGPQSQTTTTANAIDIPLPASPHSRHHRGAFISSFRRSSSAAQRRTSTANSNNTATGDEDVPDFLPFPTTTRSISLGAQDRSPPSISELLQSASPDAENHPAVSSPVDRRQTESPQALDAENTKERTASPYQPRLTPQPLDREPQAHPSHTHARRASARRFSTARSPWSNANPSLSPNPHGNGIMDEDEPLLFTMSDFGTGISHRTTTHESRRDHDRRRDRENNRESDGGGSGSGGGNPCSFHPWD